MQTSLIEWTLTGINQSPDHFTSPSDMRETVGQIEKLPLLSGLAARIMELASDPHADAARLAKVIELDPILTSQVIHWATSPLYGYRGKITSVRDAITRVLGFEFVLNAALSLAAMKPLHSPKHGTIGTKMLWTQSLMTVRIMNALSKRMPFEMRPQPREVFLVGLIHNIGFPLLSHQFPNEFKYLNKLIDNNPDLNIFNIEKFTLNIDHGLLGTWLMRTWNMPSTVVNVVYHHHNPNYQGDDFQLNLLTFLSDCLLGQIGIGDAKNQPCPETVYSKLQLSPEICDEVLKEVSQELDEVSATAEQLTS